MTMDTLTAGRELDALVAEQVMGWERREPDPAALPDPQDYPGRFHRKCIWYKDGEQQACLECGSLPGYSTDIAAAWTVVEYFKGQPFTQRMAFFDALGFLCQRHEGQGSTEAFPHAMRNITPENICLAALKAMEQPR